MNVLKSLRMHVLLAACGAATVFSFAPLEIPGLMFAALAVLFYAWRRAGSARQAGGYGFAFGLGYFCANVHWVYISMHQFGGMPAPLAMLCVLAFAAYLALFPALAGWLSRRLPCPERWRLPLLMPTGFILSEVLRGSLFTGFPWASVGSSQVSLLAGWWPVLGAYGVGFLLALVSALLVWRWRMGLLALVGIWLAGLGLSLIAWTQPIGTLAVSLAQGGIPQSERWDMRLYQQTLQRYFQLTEQARGELILLPEAAVPTLLADTPPEYLEAVRASADQRSAHLVTGFITGDMQQYFNSVMTLTGERQTYSKHHLVPFGEFVPAQWLFGWMYDFMQMPMSGFTRGDKLQPALQLGSTRLGANICYEDIFGHELSRNARGATLLANVSNMAWFDGSWAADQHLQMSRARALENGRWMIRATNTGATAIVDHRGRIVARLPERSPGVLEGVVENRTGVTPYMRWGDRLILGMLLLVCAGAIFMARRAR